MSQSVELSVVVVGMAELLRAVVEAGAQALEEQKELRTEDGRTHAVDLVVRDEQGTEVGVRVDRKTGVATFVGHDGKDKRSHRPRQPRGATLRLLEGDGGAEAQGLPDRQGREAEGRHPQAGRPALEVEVAEKTELEVTIGADGVVRIVTHGLKGQACLVETKGLEEALGQGEGRARRPASSIGARPQARTGVKSR